MKRSTTRILTTHTGSLPRPQTLINLLIEEQPRPGTARAVLDAAIQRAVAGVVQQQADAGLEVINDGEQGRVDYTVYINCHSPGRTPVTNMNGRSGRMSSFRKGRSLSLA